jgi:hypothetical protein
MNLPKTATILRMFKTAELWYFNLLFDYIVKVCSKNKLFGPRGTFNACEGTFRLRVPPALLDYIVKVCSKNKLFG